MEQLHLQPDHFFAAKRSVEMLWLRVLVRIGGIVFAAKHLPRHGA